MKKTIYKLKLCKTCEEALTLSLSVLTSCWTKSRSADLTVSGSTSVARTRYVGLVDLLRLSASGLVGLSGDPVRGIGLPLPSVVVA